MSWDLCTNAIRQGHLLPGVSLDILIARLQLMLSRRYRCLAKETLHSPARQEVLAAKSWRLTPTSGPSKRTLRPGLRRCPTPNSPHSSATASDALQPLCGCPARQQHGTRSLRCHHLRPPVPRRLRHAASGRACRPGRQAQPSQAGPCCLVRPDAYGTFGRLAPAAARPLAGPCVTVLALADLPPLLLRRPAGSGPVRRLPFPRRPGRPINRPPSPSHRRHRARPRLR
jgi:hypothetical protein